jgi:hypothetical protein
MLRTIPSQASEIVSLTVSVEGVTTIPKGSTLKRVEAPSIPILDICNGGILNDSI